MAVLLAEIFGGDSGIAFGTVLTVGSLIVGAAAARAASAAKTTEGAKATAEKVGLLDAKYESLEKRVDRLEVEEVVRKAKAEARAEARAEAALLESSSSSASNAHLDRATVRRRSDTDAYPKRSR